MNQIDDMIRQIQRGNAATVQLQMMFLESLRSAYNTYILAMKIKPLPDERQQLPQRETNHEVARKIIGNLTANYSETRVNDIIEEMYMLTKPRKEK